MLEWTLIVSAVVAAAVAIAAVGVARANRRANELIPGVSTSAPPAWAGAHSLEARLHRRLRDAARALHAAEDRSGGMGTTVIEQCRLVDEHLVAVSRLPESVRAMPLTRVATAVEAIEDVTAAVVEGRTSHLPPALEDVRERIDLLAQARAELER